MLFSVETGSTWAEIQCALLARRKAGEGAEEMTASMRLADCMEPRWMHGAARQGFHEGRGQHAWGADWHVPITLLPFTSQCAIYQQMPRKLHKGAGFMKVTPASGVAELRSGRKAGGPSWPPGAVCWPAASTVLEKLSTGVHMQWVLINSAA